MNKSTPAPMTILILGSKGLLGQALVHAYADSAHQVIPVSRDYGDLADPKVLEALCEQYAPHRIFNAVAWTGVDAAEDFPDKAMHINRGVPAALNSVLKGSSTHITHFSSDFVFNGRAEMPYTIDAKPDPISVYGKTKLAGEKAFTSLDPEQLTIIRTAWLFGYGKANFVKTILDLAATRPSIQVVHDQMGSPTFTHDLAIAAMNLAAKPYSGLFHVSNTGLASWCELADEAVRLANIHCTVQAISSADWPQKAKRPAYSALDTSAYTKATGLTMRPWTQALREFIYQDMQAKHDTEKTNTKI